MDRVRARFEGDQRPGPEEITQALWSACQGGQHEAAAFLIDHGADIDWIGWDGLTPLDAARGEHRAEFADWLRRHGARTAAEVAGAPPNETCACCGQARAHDDLVPLNCQPEIRLCAVCIDALASRAGVRPRTLPVLAVSDRVAAERFWASAGFTVCAVRGNVAFAERDGAQLLLHAAVPDSDRSPAMYLGVVGPERLFEEWSASGLPVSTPVEVESGVQFTLTDPDGNVVVVRSTD